MPFFAAWLWIRAMPQIHHRSGDMLLPCIRYLFRTGSKMDLGIHDQKQAGTLEANDVYCMSIVLCEWNILTLPILSLALGMEFALAHASAGKRVGWKPLLCFMFLIGANDIVTHTRCFHAATNITSREWLKVLASSFCPSSYVRMSSLVGTSSEDVTRAREEIKGAIRLDGLIVYGICIWFEWIMGDFVWFRFFLLRDISSFGLAWNRFDDVFSSCTSLLY
jgi:hypothetical protein